MNSTQPTSGQESSAEKSERTGHLDSMARAIFIIWIGIGNILGVVSRGPRHSHPGRATCSLADEYQD